MPTYKVSVEATVVTDHEVTIDDDVPNPMEKAEDEAVKLAMKETPAADDYQSVEVEEIE